MLALFIAGGTGFFGKSMLDCRRCHPEWKWAKSKWVILSRDLQRFRVYANEPSLFTTIATESRQLFSVELETAECGPRNWGR